MHVVTISATYGAGGARGAPHGPPRRGGAGVDPGLPPAVSAPWCDVHRDHQVVETVGVEITNR